MTHGVYTEPQFAVASLSRI